MVDISDEVRRLVCKHLGIDGDRGQPEASLVDDLGADSLALVELTLVFEETFDIDIPDEAVERIRTVRDAITTVEAYLPPRRAG